MHAVQYAYQLVLPSPDSTMGLLRIRSKHHVHIQTMVPHQILHTRINVAIETSY